MNFVFGVLMRKGVYIFVLRISFLKFLSFTYFVLIENCGSYSFFVNRGFGSWS